MKFACTILIACIILLSGCKQDLQIASSQYVDTPVIYGLLNLHDYGSDGNTHYIRIQKGYLLKGNAYLATGITDSIYYPDNLNVKLFPSNGTNPFTLNRIDGSTVGLNKDTGIFANAHNYLYTFYGYLDSTQSYTLVVTRNGGTDTVAMATTALVNNWQIFSPSNLGYSTINFSNVPGQEAVMSWSPAQNAGVYDLKIRFFYREYAEATNTLQKDTFIDIPIFTSLIPSGASGSQTLTYTLPSSIILHYLARNLVTDPTLYREFKTMQFKFAAGGTGLASYFNAQQAQSGLTSSNALPIFTNVTGGVGLLSSREYQEIDNIGLSNMGLDSLACDPTANFLKFKNSSGNTCN